MDTRVTFALVGVAGYVAEKHLKAIQDVDGRLVAACDVSDSVGILDKYFPNCTFFQDYAEFLQFLDATKMVELVTICSPNYLHSAHAIPVLRAGMDVILEKPAVIHPQHLLHMLDVEEETGHRVSCISQLRYHPAVISWLSEPPTKPRHKVTVIYYAPRGCWYDMSWKSDRNKSGGIAYNIGIHLFDLTTHLFGRLDHIKWVTVGHDQRSIAGSYALQFADVNFTLKTAGMGPKRIMQIDDTTIDLSTHITDLHGVSYQRIMDGKGIGLEEVREGIELCHKLSRHIRE